MKTTLDWHLNRYIEDQSPNGLQFKFVSSQIITQKSQCCFSVCNLYENNEKIITISQAFNRQIPKNPLLWHHMNRAKADLETVFNWVFHLRSQLEKNDINEKLKTNSPCECEDSCLSAVQQHKPYSNIPPPPERRHRTEEHCAFNCSHTPQRTKKTPPLSHHHLHHEEMVWLSFSPAKFAA